MNVLSETNIADQESRLEVKLQTRYQGRQNRGGGGHKKFLGRPPQNVCHIKKFHYLSGSPSNADSCTSKDRPLSSKPCENK